MRPLSFKNWISNFKNVDLPIGDLANDIANDKIFPSTSDKQEIYSYLRKKRACNEALETFEHAWNYYIKTR